MYIIQSGAQRNSPPPHSNIKRTQNLRRTFRYTNCYYISTTNKLQINIRFHFSYVITQFRRFRPHTHTHAHPIHTQQQQQIRSKPTQTIHIKNNQNQLMLKHIFCVQDFIRIYSFCYCIRISHCSQTFINTKNHPTKR